jgi:hypothetical protein
MNPGPEAISLDNALSAFVAFVIIGGAEVGGSSDCPSPASAAGGRHLFGFLFFDCWLAVDALAHIDGVESEDIFRL